VVAARTILDAIRKEHDLDIASIKIGEANASIASTADIVVSSASDATEFMQQQERSINDWLHETFSNSDPRMHCTITESEPQAMVISRKTIEALMTCLQQIPQGVVKMSDVMKDTVETSNNIGRILTEEDHIFVSTHTRSFIDSEMDKLSRAIANVFAANGATSHADLDFIQWHGVKPVTDGIESIVDRRTAAAQRIYTLQGIRLQQLQRGLNIVDGKKVMVK
jgi:dipeptidase D